MRPVLLLALASILAVGEPVQAGFDAGNVFVASIGQARVYELNPAGDVIRELGSTAPLDAPRGLAFGPDGNLYVTSGDTIIVLDAQDQVVRTIANPALVAPRGLAFGPQGHLFCTAVDHIVEVTVTGDLVRTFGADAGLGVPIGMAFSTDGTLVVASGGSNELVLFEPGGQRIGAIAPPDLAIPTGIALGADGNLYIASLLNSTVIVLDHDFSVAGTIADAALTFPSGLAFGPDRNLYVTSLLTDRVVAFDGENTKVRELTGASQLLQPEGIAFAPWRIKVKVSGSVAQSGAPFTKVSGKGFLSYLPGSGTAMVELQGGAETGVMRQFAVVHGVESAAGPKAKERSLHGQESASSGSAAVLSSMLVEVTGKSIDFGPGTAFKPQEGKVAWQSAHANVVFKGALKFTGTKN